MLNSCVWPFSVCLDWRKICLKKENWFHLVPSSRTVWLVWQWSGGLTLCMCLALKTSSVSVPKINHCLGRFDNGVLVWPSASEDPCHCSTVPLFHCSTVPLFHCSASEDRSSSHHPPSRTPHTPDPDRAFLSRNPMIPFPKPCLRFGETSSVFPAHF